MTKADWFTNLVIVLTLLVVGVWMAGCSATNLADVITAAGTDPATVCARVTTIYGTLTYLRSNIQASPAGGDVSCDTLTVKTTAPPTSVSIPMTITPSFTIRP